MVAPGTAVREGIDNIVHARTGGLIVIGDPDELAFLFSGGIKLDIDYSPALLYQLAKMDGAIALNANATKIPWCNVQLMPDPTILTTETGTRHRTAERVSKQTDALVIAVSQRRDVVSLYVDGAKYILEEIPAVLAKANQALATLDKYRSRLDQVSTRLTALEFEGGVTLHDVLTVLQRAELVTRMAVEIERYIVELGTEGRLIEMQLEETMVGVAADKAALLHDYLADVRRRGLRQRARRHRPAAAPGPARLRPPGRAARATTARSTRSTIPSRPAATASSAASRGCRSSWCRTSSASSAGWTRSSPRPTPSWSRSTAWERSARRTSARAFAGCRRSTSWTVTCRHEPHGGPASGPTPMKEDTIPETIDQIEDLELEREVECIDFEIGDNVVYPHHGAGQVVKKEDKKILGEVRQYLTIKILHNDMTVMVPCENAGKAGLRRVIDEETVKKVLGVLSDDVSEMPKNWNRRFKHNRDKIKTGDIYELAEVVRNLAIREQDKGLSTGEKQMYTRAKKILASELMYALEKSEDEAEAYLDDVLTREKLAAAG